MEILKEQTVRLNFCGGGVIECPSLETKNSQKVLSSRYLFTGLEYFCDGNKHDQVSITLIIPNGTSITPVQNAYIGVSGCHQFYRAILEAGSTIQIEYANKGPLASDFRYNLILHSELGG